MPIEDSSREEQYTRHLRQHWDDRIVKPLVEVTSSRFCGSDGVEEIHYMLRPATYAPLSDQLDWIEEALEEALATADLRPENVVFRRVFCSDLPNQSPYLATRGYSTGADCRHPGAISLVNQPPQPPAKVSLWVYCIKDPKTTAIGWREGHSYFLQRGTLEHVWTTGLSAPDGPDSHDQTLCLFDEYISGLGRHGMCMEQSLVRTWLLVKDIDSNYSGMVEARNVIFARNGLTPQTHFVASTGIEGSYSDVRAKVLMDAYAINGILPEQIRYLKALDHLNPTHEYGVAFERATAVEYSDRTQVFVSGTASIDNHGKVLHEGNVLRQLDRVFQNIAALLDNADATLDDMQIYIVYVRDTADAGIVRTLMKERVGDTPFEVLIAPVCRPAWLVELEGMACLPATSPQLPAF